MSALEYVNPIYNALRIVSKDRTPRQLAMAVALGMMIGLLPKGNLLAAGFTMMLLTLRVNLGIGLTTAFLVTLCSGTIDPLTHGIGLRMLRHPNVYPLLSELHQLPVVPWMSLNNTVVLGSFVLGIGLFYPTYHGSERAFERLLPALRSLHGKGKHPDQDPGAQEASATHEATSLAHRNQSASGDSLDKASTAAVDLAAATSTRSTSQPAFPSQDSFATASNQPAPPAAFTSADLLAALGSSVSGEPSRDAAALMRPPLMTRATLPTRKLATMTAAAERLQRAMPPEPSTAMPPHGVAPVDSANPFASLLPPPTAPSSPLASTPSGNADPQSRSPSISPRGEFLG